MSGFPARTHRAVFLDRDGTINEEVGYLDRLEALRLIPGAAGAIRRLNAAGWKVVVVTNQSGVARGYFDEAFLAAVHDRLRALLAEAGARLDGVYHCPHHPDHGEAPYRRSCGCRKPAPGLLLRAAAELDLDLGRAFLVGDTLRDMEAANRAGVRGILVRTGYGETELAMLGGDAFGETPPDAALAAGGKVAASDPLPPQRAGLPPDPRRPHHVSADLATAAAWILEGNP